MTGTTLTSAALDPRRRRTLFRAWHRGTREMDLIMGRFADSALSEMSEADLDAFEALIEAQDDDLFRWVTGEAQPPAAYATPLLARLLAFHAGPSAPFRP